VTTYLAGRDSSALSVEYTILGLVAPGFRSKPWTPADSVAWLKAMAWGLNTGVGNEVRRAMLAASLPPETVDELFPTYDYAHQPVIVPQAPGAPAGGASTSTGSAPAGGVPAGARPALRGPAATERALRRSLTKPGKRPAAPDLVSAVRRGSAEPAVVW
jgi:penicillin G amidase